MLLPAWEPRRNKVLRGDPLGGPGYYTLSKLDRYTHALADAAIFACGLAMQLGL